MFRAVLLCVLIAGCSGASSTGIDVSTLTCPPDSTLTYENFGQPLFENRCLSCHDRKRPILETVDQILANRDSILQEAVATTSMPQNEDMPLEERELLGEWLACGAP